MKVNVRTWVCVLLVASFFIPNTSAVLVKEYNVKGDFLVNVNTKWVLLGETFVSGTIEGNYTGESVDSVFTNISTLGMIEGDNITYYNNSVLEAKNGSIVWQIPKSVVSGNFNFSFSSFGFPSSFVTYSHSGIVNIDFEDNQTSVLVPSDSAITIKNEYVIKEIMNCSDIGFVLIGKITSVHKSIVNSLPADNINVKVKASSNKDFIGEMATLKKEEAEVVNIDLLDKLGAIAPIFNGMITCSHLNGSLNAGNMFSENPETVMMRGCFEFKLNDGRIDLSGNCRFVFIDNRFAGENDMFWSWVGFFWWLGISAVIIGWVLKRMYGKEWNRSIGIKGFDDRIDKKLRIPSIFVQIILIIFAFCLWDSEISALFGFSVFPLIGDMLGAVSIGKVPMGLGLVAAISIGLFSFASFIFGYPIHLLLKLVSKTFGLEKSGKHITSGFSSLMAYYFGANFITMFLDIMLNPPTIG